MEKPNPVHYHFQLTGADGERRHHRGCHCKRSGCLKNYCECYEAKVACNQTCKCIGCKNMYNDPLPPPPGSKPSIGADGKTIGSAEVGDRSGVGGQHTGGTPSSGGGVNMLLTAHRRTELRPSLKSKLGAVNAENGK